jgi:hypothetical protein
LTQDDLFKRGAVAETQRAGAQAANRPRGYLDDPCASLVEA